MGFDRVRLSPKNRTCQNLCYLAIIKYWNQPTSRAGSQSLQVKRPIL
jgi:hypothetical protein